MADPATRIVSLTVTEGGYNFHPVTGRFDAENPAIQADLAPGAVPATIFGLITDAVARRRERGIEPFTVMSCDNIQSNGHIAQEVFTAFARLRDPELGDWVEANVRFPNSMVDRITPVTTDDDRIQIKERFGWTPGRSSANHSPSGRWRTISRPAGRRLKTSVSRWSRTWCRTS